MRISSQKERGSVLITTLVITGLVTVTVLALLAVSQRQNYFAARAATWHSEIPIAEAGIEEAMAHINSRPRTLETNGWVKTGSNYVKSISVGTNADYAYTMISTSKPLTIVSIGYGAVPLRTNNVRTLNNFTQRKVMVMTKENPSVYGVRAKGTIKMGGATVIDSFDSSNPLYSTGQKYRWIQASRSGRRRHAIHRDAGHSRRAHLWVCFDRAGRNGVWLNHWGWCLAGDQHWRSRRSSSRRLQYGDARCEPAQPCDVDHSA